MITSTLRNVGGSVMMAIPKSLLEGMGLAANTKVALSLEKGKLVVVPQLKPKYSLTELLAQGNNSAQADEDAWNDTPPVGREVW